MKQCRVCTELKDDSDFYRRLTSRDGFRSECKVCLNAQQHTRYIARHEANKEWHREHYRKKMELNPTWQADNYAVHREKMSVYNATYYREHYRSKRLAQVKQWVQDNPGMANASKKAYKVAKINACPPWVRSNPELMWVMSQVYDLAAMRSEMFGFPWHVDHVVPLRGKVVSGLHVPWNLQVIPGVDNMSKSNKFTG